MHTFEAIFAGNLGGPGRFRGGAGLRRVPKGFAGRERRAAGNRPSAAGAPALLAAAVAAVALPAAVRCGEEAAPDGTRTAEARAIASGTIQTTGRIVSLKTAMIGPDVSGKITAIGESGGRPLDVGSRVEKGQELWRQDEEIHALAVEQARAAVARAEAALADLKAWVRPEKREAMAAEVRRLEAAVRDAEKDLERMKRLAAEKSVPDRRVEEAQLRLDTSRAALDVARAQLKEAEAGPTPAAVRLAEAQVAEARAALARAEKSLRDAVVRAPFPGIVAARFRGVGDYLNTMPVTEVFQLVSLEHLEAEFYLPEKYMAAVRPGVSTISISSDLLPEKISVPVIAVGPTVNAQTGTFVFRAAIPPDRRGSLAPGAFVRGELSPDAGAAGKAGAEAVGGVAVPADAVVREGGGTFVFLVGADGRLIRRPVTVRAVLTNETILEAGLAPGDRVAIAPRGAVLKEGMRAPAAR
ncbi:MAG: efflux RND transporter periplasmic adaptor subunit [Planctomycetota bacterium]|nr:efflux RND transporter periplasmic adaptor subunit [Planctomycetota bacterium]